MILRHMTAGLALGAALGAGPACAAQHAGQAREGDAAGPAAVMPDADAGRTAGATVSRQKTGDTQARAWAYSCATCHGAERSAVQGIPTLAGMPASQLVQAMQDYASGERPGLLMSQIARGYDEAVLQRIGAWYESQSRNTQEQP